MTVFSPLATPTATRDVLSRYGLSLKKSLGQNFLVNDDILGKILSLAQVDGQDYVLEIGPGIGTLTYALLEKAARVVSIERDPSLPDILSETLAAHSEKFTLVQKDALDLVAEDIAKKGAALEDAAAEDIVALGQDSLGQGEKVQETTFPNKLVANLPYAVAATIVLDYFQRFDFIDSMTVMVQREVAERMMAKPGTKNYGAYTVKLSMYAQLAGSFSVGSGNFMPPPHVESTVIRLDRIRQAHSIPNLISAACTMADAAFASRRKTIANSCKHYFAGRDKRIAACIPEILEKANVSPEVRGETLTREQFIDLGRALKEFRV